MDPAKYEYQSDFAKRYVAQGVTQGINQGITQGNVQVRAALIIRQLTLRFGPLTDGVSSRIASASIEELDAMGERLLTAKTLQEALNV